MNPLPQTLSASISSPWYQYPVNFLRAKFDQARSRLRRRSPLERRVAMVGPIHLWKMKRDFQISFLKGVGMAPEHYVLDLGCGVLRGGLPIIEYLNPGHYYGIESRGPVLEEGKMALREAGLESKAPALLLIDDLSSAMFDRKFDLIWAFSVLIHMEDSILDSCLEFASRQLGPEGRMYANVNIGNGKERKWKEFPVVSRSRHFYQAAAGRRGLQVRDVGTLSSLGHVSGSPGQDLQMMLQFFHKSQTAI